MNIKIHDSMVKFAKEISDGEYDIPGLNLPENATVLDLGANCGAFTAWALQRWPTCRVIAYEPNPEAFGFLYENFKDNERVECVNSAVGVKEGRGIMFKGKNNLGESSFTMGDEQRAVTYDVKIDATAGIPAAHFAKIDIEGSEQYVVPHIKTENLLGMAIEWHGEDAEASIKQSIPTGYESSFRATMPNRGIAKIWKPEAVTAKPTPSVYIGIPVHYQPTTAFMLSCMAMLEKLRIPARWKVLQGDSHPDRARNRIVSEFLETDSEYLLFLDADLKFDPAQVLTLLNRGKDIICGFYAKKTPGPAQWVGNAMTVDPDADGLVTMREAGTGCLLIHRRVFEAMKRAYPERAYLADGDANRTEWDFFSSGVRYDPRAKRRRWLSEDWAFCQDAIECGFTIYGDQDVVCLHEGACMFPTEPSEESTKKESVCK